MSDVAETVWTPERLAESIDYLGKGWGVPSDLVVRISTAFDCLVQLVRDAHTMNVNRITRRVECSCGWKVDAPSPSACPTLHREHVDGLIATACGGRP